MREINQEGLNLIKNWETCELVAYVCPAGVLTIGWGHTGHDVRRGMKITQAEADGLLIRDVAIASRAVERLVKVPISDNQFSALVSFVFNVGETQFKTSTLLRLLNEGKDCTGQFARWNKSKGKVLNGLTKRREEEKVLFLKP
jgi:lysozyme